MATSYPYDLQDGAQDALRSHTAEINDHLQARDPGATERAGVTVIEARIRHLAYAPEIAQAMLQRQQAERDHRRAHAHRRRRGHAWSRWRSNNSRKRGVVQLDEERKAAMVSNLLVVLCGERGTQPIVNTGTLYTWLSRWRRRKPIRCASAPTVLDAVQRWAEDELRSVNAQIEYVLREALRKSGRMKSEEKPKESD